MFYVNINNHADHDFQEQKRLPYLDCITQSFPMPKRSSKATSKKNLAAVVLGRLGGLKGGPARMAKLSARARSELARKAVMTRWSRQK